MLHELYLAFLLLELYHPPVPTFGIEPKFYNLSYMFYRLNYIGIRCSTSCSVLLEGFEPTFMRPEWPIILNPLVSQ